jgi:hypothetical protein
MTSFHEVRLMVLGRGQTDACVGELATLLASEAPLRELGARASTAQIEFGTFKIRQTTTQTAGIANCGFEATLEALRQLPDKSPVTVFSVRAKGAVYNVFVSADAIIGCIRVSLRERVHREAPELHNEPLLTLLENYARAAQAYQAAADSGERLLALRQRESASSIFDELSRRRSESALFTLLDREDDAIRFAVGRHALKFSPADGERVLLALAAKAGSIAAAAKTVLDDWRADLLLDDW